MASDDYGQITTILQRLAELGSLLNPATLVATVEELAREVSSPPPGQPDELEDLAVAFRAAASAIEPIGSDARALGSQQLPEVWEGLAGGSAAQVITATAEVVEATPVAFRDASTVLQTLAEQVRESQRRHGELHQSLHDAFYDATHVMGLLFPDPFALDDLVCAVGELIGGALQLYTDAISAADTAAAAFSDITGAARTAAGVRGGLGAADAVLLAGQHISIDGFGDDYDDAVLTPAQLTRAGQQLGAMDPAQRAQAEDLLRRAGFGTERAYLLEAIAAGHSGAALTGFADTIRGRSADWPHSHLNLIDPGGSGPHERFGALINQFDDTTCGTTSLIVTRAAADPLYALTFTEGIEDLDDPRAMREEFDRRFAAEQTRVHDETNGRYPESLGTTQGNGMFALCSCLLL